MQIADVVSDLDHRLVETRNMSTNQDRSGTFALKTAPQALGHKATFHGRERRQIRSGGDPSENQKVTQCL